MPVFDALIPEDVFIVSRRAVEDTAFALPPNPTDSRSSVRLMPLGFLVFTDLVTGLTY